MTILQEIQKIPTNWKNILQNIYQDNSEKSQNLETFLEKQRQDFEGLCEIYPPSNQIFTAFSKFNFEELKVVIIGQDPYHGPGQANGLCFSVNENIKIPPSLRNIFTEIKNDNGLNDNGLNDINFSHGNLESWADQGVLLLNTALSVRQAKPNSHSVVWKYMTDEIIKYIVEFNRDIIFLLWGNHAKICKKLLTSNNISKHYFLESNHPSPLSANRGGWFGNKHFSKTNQILQKLEKEPIKWIL